MAFLLQAAWCFGILRNLNDMAVEHIPGGLFWGIYLSLIGSRNSPVWEERQMFCREVKDGQVNELQEDFWFTLRRREDVGTLWHLELELVFVLKGTSLV